MRLSNQGGGTGRQGDKGTRGFEFFLPLFHLFPYLPVLPSPCLLVSLSPCLFRSRSLSPSSSSSSSMARTKALRTGAGIRESAPRTDFQMISLNSTSGAASIRGCLRQCAAPSFAPSKTTMTTKETETASEKDKGTRRQGDKGMGGQVDKEKGETRGERIQIPLSPCLLVSLSLPPGLTSASGISNKSSGPTQRR